MRVIIYLYIIIYFYIYPPMYIYISLSTPSCIHCGFSPVQTRPWILNIRINPGHLNGPCMIVLLLIAIGNTIIIIIFMNIIVKAKVKASPYLQFQRETRIVPKCSRHRATPNPDGKAVLCLSNRSNQNGNRRCSISAANLSGSACERHLR